MAQFNSKNGIVSKRPEELYMAFSDMRNFCAMLPEDKKQMIQADFDTLRATVQGFTVGVKVCGRVPYSLIQIQDNDAPFHFGVSLFFNPTPDGLHTDFHIEADADLNTMMKMMLGSKIQEGLDKIVDGLVAASEGRIPEGMPSDFKI